jgi:hypothetical protein
MPPRDCPSSASVGATYDAGPDPIKIYELPPDKILDTAAATRIAAVMLENPNNQLYILAGEPKAPRFRFSGSVCERKGSPLQTWNSRRIAFTTATSHTDVDSMQFWRVPPGAENPRCEECEEFLKPRARWEF